MARTRAALAALGLFAAGCALTPDYERPPLEVPATFEQAEVSGESIANLPWWDLFQDPQLRAYIDIALVENKDLAEALARIDEARNFVTVVRADQFPFVDGAGSAGRGKPSEALVPDATTSDEYAIAGILSFEVDLWRKFARATEAARAELLASEAAYRNVTISLVADVASAYFALRDVDERLEISRRTVRTRQDSLGIIRARFEKGTVPELDVNQAEIELATAEVAVSAFERSAVQVANVLRILLGRNPGPVERGLSLYEQVLPPEVPAGLPSELLQRRPDVVAAEEALIAETARIGVAEALRYPSLSLTGSLGVAADSFDVDANVRAWSIAAGLFAPIWNSGQLKAQAEAQRAFTEQVLQRYAATLLQAFRETEDALVAVRTLREEHGARKRQVVAARNAARLSRARYDGGVVDYLEVLESERSLFSSELDESNTLSQSLIAVVQLYKALGGGWNPPEPPGTPAP